MFFYIYVQWCEAMLYATIGEDTLEHSVCIEGPNHLSNDTLE